MPHPCHMSPGTRMLLSTCLCSPGAAKLAEKPPLTLNPSHFRAPLNPLRLQASFSLNEEGRFFFLHCSSCKKILSKKRLSVRVPLAGPLSEQSSALCAAAEVKSQLVTGSKSHSVAAPPPRRNAPCLGKFISASSAV